MFKDSCTGFIVNGSFKSCKDLGYGLTPEAESKGEILRPPGRSVSQTIVFRYDEIGDILRTKHRKKLRSYLNIF
jgi:hypothetical protein